uniref:PH domain-containing protein n=1 Tax=Knipowitschia caucasica TaxID=637954 RepID=A0AAV2LRS5_KNICA
MVTACAVQDQRSTVLSLQKLIVREVANEERGLFLITAGIEKPEMMEVLASSKEERNSWMQRIQDAMQAMAALREKRIILEEAAGGGGSSRRRRQQEEAAGGGSGRRQREEAAGGGSGRRQREEAAGGGGSRRRRQQEEAAGGGSGRRQREEAAGGGSGRRRQQEEEAAGGGSRRRQREEAAGGGSGRRQREEAAGGGGSRRRRQQEEAAGGGSGRRQREEAAGGGSGRRQREEAAGGGSSRRRQQQEEAAAGGGSRRRQREEAAGGGGRRRQQEEAAGGGALDKDEDEGIPSETEDDKRQLETKAREMRDLLKQKDTEILSLLEEKVRLFRGMWEGLSSTDETCHQGPFFRSDCSQEPPRGAAIMKEALQEVETLQALVSGSLGGAMASIQGGAAGAAGAAGAGGAAGAVCLPRRAETFGGFDSHQMLSNKSAAKDENLDTADLRRTGSDSVLKKGGNANLLLVMKRNSELLRSVSHLHLLLSSLQAVVVQQDSFIEDQRQALSERSSSGSSLGSSLGSSSVPSQSRSSSRPGSLIEQEKQRSLEKQRQDLTSLHRQQAAHADQRKRREKEWEQREQLIAHKEALMHAQEEEILQQHDKMEVEKQELQNRKEEYQRDLERLRDAQRKLERDRETVQRQLDRMDELRLSQRLTLSTSEQSQLVGSSQSLELEPVELSSVPSLRSKSKGKGLNPFTSSSTNASCKNSEANSQLSKGLLQLAKNKSKESKDRDKKKKKKKGDPAEDGPQIQEAPLDGEIFFC